MCAPKAYAPRRVCMQLPFLFIYTGWRASSGSQASPIAPRPVRSQVAFTQHRASPSSTASGVRLRRGTAVRTSQVPFDAWVARSQW